MEPVVCFHRSIDVVPPQCSVNAGLSIFDSKQAKMFKKKLLNLIKRSDQVILTLLWDDNNYKISKDLNFLCLIDCTVLRFGPLFRYFTTVYNFFLLLISYMKYC